MEFSAECITQTIDKAWEGLLYFNESNIKIIPLSCLDVIEQDIVRAVKILRAGYTLRKNQDAVEKQAFNWNSWEQRWRGRPKTIWKRTVEVKMKELGNSWSEVKATVFSSAALKTPYVGWSDKK